MDTLFTLYLQKGTFRFLSVLLYPIFRPLYYILQFIILFLKYYLVAPTNYFLPLVIEFFFEKRYPSNCLALMRVCKVFIDYIVYRLFANLKYNCVSLLQFS